MGHMEGLVQHPDASIIHWGIGMKSTMQALLFVALHIAKSLGEVGGPIFMHKTSGLMWPVGEVLEKKLIEVRR